MPDISPEAHIYPAPDYNFTVEELLEAFAICNIPEPQFEHIMEVLGAIYKRKEDAAADGGIRVIGE